MVVAPEGRVAVVLGVLGVLGVLEGRTADLVDRGVLAVLVWTA